MTHLKPRTILELAILTVITFGIYPVIWWFKTRKEINSLGADIPTPWLMFVPFGDAYFYYSYSQAFDDYIKKDGLTLIYFLITILPIILVSFNTFNQFPATYIFTYGFYLKTIYSYTLFSSIRFIPMMIFQLGLNELFEKEINKG